MTTSSDVASRKLAAGMVTGAFTKTVTAPLERVKILLQIQAMTGSSTKYQGILRSARTVVMEEGFFRLWKGNGANVLRVMPVYGLKFGINDMLRDMVRRPGQKGDLSFTQLFCAGSMAGTVTVGTTYPLETVSASACILYARERVHVELLLAAHVFTNIALVGVLIILDALLIDVTRTVANATRGG